MATMAVNAQRATVARERLELKMAEDFMKLEEEVKVLREIRKQYESKYHVRMFANGEFEET